MVLRGRETELKELGELVDGPEDRAGVLIRGEAGIGKSALVTETAAAASVAGLRVLRTTGAEGEQNLAYAGLHQLLYPVRAGAAELPAPQRDALRTALGLADGTEPSAYLVGLAALTLLAEEAAAKPLLLVAEDAQWLDRASADVLAFVARRIETEPIVLVATLRDGAESPLLGAGLAPMPLDRLAADAAAELLDSVAPRLAPAVRTRLLAEAAGLPLALTELPAAAVDLDGLDPVLPLTERLERTFTARVSALPAATQTALLVAALNETTSLAETLTAAAMLLELTGAEPEILAPAVEARLIELSADVLTFRHPLMRSAIPAAANAIERRKAHLALVEALRDQPDRRAWHQAAATAGPDEAVAGELERTAERARYRGGAAAAIAALEQAARLSCEAGPRADRLLKAAELAVDSGRRETAERLVRDARPADARRRATASRLLSEFEDGVREDPARVAELAGVARAVAADGQHDAAMRILWSAAMRCFWTEPGPQARQALLDVADLLPVPDDDPRIVAVTAYVAPFERGEAVLKHLRALAARTGADPEVDRYLGSAALQVGAFDLAARFSAAAAPGLRAQGRLGLLPRALAVLAWSRVRLGDLAGAVPAAAEAARFAQETGQPFMGGLATAVQAEIAALRGDHRQAGALAAEAERAGLAAGARPVLATVQLARGLTNLSEGRFEDAFADLRRLLDPADPAYQLALRAYCVAELTEAAVRAGQTDAMRDILAELECLETPSPALHVGLRYARAVLDPSDARFAEALQADLAGWPAERGRVHLAFGEWLRRQRRVVESRTHLRTARETFDALGMTAWAERARRELRSAGESSPNRGPDARDKLTPHELSIAQLAAEGLTNREIGQRLYLSHRTVGTHLHRIFPKLGVSSRADLAGMLKTLEG
ncbi:DNA-binding CsgD family transcriptional regulator/predicted transcriptional regulator [Amycolatopsis lexingtonensis]|uniref:DNA-binding CsgD family transcriptional regulator/predicted transcriptional regulator n=1 Tax=Amycolatopsis lexingtonensis TaxID=218822 RepID=A0ABR9IEW8_9PSEU|nr:LuxR family transcriptional regulator [Amycolatopsis lexingtonensis]MBE1501714.1 DNA-binding CsgD family transcriptional regulator/predicted transcriptional regulator [Amycolatopsis lexingtonensis]